MYVCIQEKNEISHFGVGQKMVANSYLDKCWYKLDTRMMQRARNAKNN